MVFVSPWSVLTNLTVCAPAGTETWTFGVVPSDLPSRKQVDGGIELMLRKPSPPPWAAALPPPPQPPPPPAATAPPPPPPPYAAAGGAPFVSSVTVKLFSACPSSKVIGCEKSP